MSARKKELIDIIETLPDELFEQAIEYIEYLKYLSVINNVPENLIIKDKKDLRKKLEEGIKDTENGKVCSIDEAFSEIDEILAK